MMETTTSAPASLWQRFRNLLLNNVRVCTRIRSSNVNNRWIDGGIFSYAKKFIADTSEYDDYDGTYYCKYRPS